MEENILLTPEEAAKILRVPLGVMYQYLRQGLVPAGKLGRHWRIARKQLEKFIEDLGGVANG